jgi:hypothetical protein
MSGPFKDMNLDEFIDMIYSNECLDPFAYNFDVEMEQGSLVQFLGKFVVTGARKLYNKEIAHLTEIEVEKIRSYLLSIGWDVEYEMVCESKTVTDYKPDGTSFKRDIPLNNWKIQFKRADPKLMTNTGGCGDKLI